MVSFPFCLWPLLSQVLRKDHQMMENRNQDYISLLPDSLLCHIISFLKIIEVVKTSAVSRKWRYICTNPTNLILDADNVLERDCSVTNICPLSQVLRFEIERTRTKTFVRNVNKYLSRVEKVQKIDKLKVCFTFLHKGYGCTDLDDWICFNVKRNVEEIDLCLLEENQLSAPTNGSLYVFPCDIVGNGGAPGSKSFLKCLRLAHCVLAPNRSYNSGFTTLTTLELLKVDLKSKEHIGVLLSSCSNLEWLSFSECYNMDYLKIEDPLCQMLKYLNVSDCRQLKAIVIQSTNLETMEYMGCKIDFIFHAPNLKTFLSRHREIWPVLKLSIDLPQLETLFLECSCEMGRGFQYLGEVMRNTFPTFHNLRHLEVIKEAIHRQELSWIAIALKTCPTLGRLDLHLRTHFHIDEELRKTSWPPRCTHNHLKEVAITGIKGHTSEIEIAIYLLNNAISLEKMTVDPRQRIYHGKGKWGHSEACENWSRDGRQKVHMLLKQEVSSLVELIIL